MIIENTMMKGFFFFFYLAFHNKPLKKLQNLCFNTFASFYLVGYILRNAGQRDQC